jgi:hypothetical protein
MRRIAAVLGAALVVAACTSTPPGDGSQSPSREPPRIEVLTGPTTALQTMKRLCIQPKIVSPPVKFKRTPPTIAQVESEVEQVRGLRYDRRVNVEPVTDAEIDRRLREYFKAAYPKRFYARRTEAWATIGAIPRGIGILEALNRYQQGQVLGFYNSQNEELVYAGDADLTRVEQFVLAHELTHAIDDQHFDLDRLDRISQTCDDERFLAGLGVVEGSANYFATQVVFRFPIQETGDVGGSAATGVPPLIVEVQSYPYTSGQTFVDSLADGGGPAAVNQALERFPRSTEQVLHPSKFREDEPTPVDVPDFGPTFGAGWKDLDVMLAGELWLRALLNTRLDAPTAERAAAGWDGGIYRAWSDGQDVAVILRTVWDTEQDARGFASALRAFVGAGAGIVMDPSGKAVDAGFASSAELLPTVGGVLRSLA